MTSLLSIGVLAILAVAGGIDRGGAPAPHTVQELVEITPGGWTIVAAVDGVLVVACDDWAGDGVDNFVDAVGWMLAGLPSQGSTYIDRLKACRENAVACCAPKTPCWVQYTEQGSVASCMFACPDKRGDCPDPPAPASPPAH